MWVARYTDAYQFIHTYVYVCTLYVGLVGGSFVYEGRVEIFRGNSWTTVCDDGWDSTDADVFCRQIGYPGAEFSYGLAQFGEGSGTIQIRNVACTGTETDIRDCTFSTDANIACSHSEDAGVRCLRNISKVDHYNNYCYFIKIINAGKQG